MANRRPKKIHLLNQRRTAPGCGTHVESVRSLLTAPSHWLPLCTCVTINLREMMAVGREKEGERGEKKKVSKRVLLLLP